MRELTELRQELDRLDRELVALFERRMDVSREVARYKIAHGLPVLDRSREDQVIASRTAMLNDADLAPSLRALYDTILSLSRQEQEKCFREVHGDA